MSLINESQRGAKESGRYPNSCRTAIPQTVVRTRQGGRFVPGLYAEIRPSR
jgi:hypothetical protein